jgi:hypothetical protein
MRHANSSGNSFTLDITGHSLRCDVQIWSLGGWDITGSLFVMLFVAADGRFLWRSAFGEQMFSRRRDFIDVFIVCKPIGAGINAWIPITYISLTPKEYV